MWLHCFILILYKLEFFRSNKNGCACALMRDACIFSEQAKNRRPFSFNTGGDAMLAEPVREHAMDERFFEIAYSDIICIFEKNGRLSWLDRKNRITKNGKTPLTGG